MGTFYRCSAGILAGLALLAYAVTLIADVSHGWTPAPLQRWTGAAALILIGFASGLFQFGGPRSKADRAKGVVLAVGFILWGATQLLPRGRLSDAGDAVVVGIFVIDLVLIILGPPRGQPDL